MNFARHDLVWFLPDINYPPDLNEWLSQGLPCVVTRQAVTDPINPAPLLETENMPAVERLNIAWCRDKQKSILSRRSHQIAKDVIIRHTRPLPLNSLLTLFINNLSSFTISPNQQTQTSGAFAAIQQAISALEALALDPRLYGSFSWQLLTKQEYVTTHSDLDLVLTISNLPQLDSLHPLLLNLEAKLLRRLDGELIFPAGQAVAWREWFSASDRVLAKSLVSVELITRNILSDTLVKF